MTMQLHQLFPTAIATVQLALDPLDVAGQLQVLFALRGDATGNPTEGCAWTGDLHGALQLHQHPDFVGLSQQVIVVEEQVVDALLFEMTYRAA